MSTSNDVWLVAGLGNPGAGYVGNRHNAGFMVLDVLAERAGSRFKVHKAHAHMIEGKLAGQRVVLAKPLSHMNNSGSPVAALRSFFKVPVEHIVVIHDELDIPYGELRLKRGGGEGGHNGLKSITSWLGSRDYLRVRFGISRPPGRMNSISYVLRDFTATERAELPYQLERAADAVEILLTHSLEHAQNTYHA